ncbi:hypothetical protein FACS1894140_0510 [Spirochaetia bacterium]|nr:hypothetical protein FACS1894140_0510 [Spirochaetia bacterium]
MKNSMTRFSSLFLIVLSVAILAGCATTIPVQVTKLPRVDTSAISKIVVEPFDVSQDTQDERQLAEYLSRTIGDKVLSTNRFTIIEAEDFAQIKKRGENYADVADAWYSGEINRFTVTDSSYEDEVYDSAAKERVPKTMYKREVELEFSYRLVRARDGGIIDRLTLAGTESAKSEDPEGLTPAQAIARKIVDKQLQNMPRDIAPWTTTEQRTLEKDTTKNPRMKDAVALVKAGSYRDAQILYSSIYAETGNFAAGYNAAITAELQGYLPEAIELMSRLNTASGNPKARSEYQRMEAALAESKTLETRYDASNVGSPVLAAIKEGAAGLTPRLKPGARITFLNVSKIETLLAGYIAEELTGQMVNSGSFRVVERENLELIRAEQNFQMSGDVSDETAVSIGRILGVETIITCSISEQQRVRRLLIKALSVETAEILYQNSLTL